MIDETVNYDSGIRNYNRRHEGKRAFITTAARGIGKSIAILFARQGATVYFAGRNECYVRETESELQLLAPESRGYICDLADGAQSEETAALVLRDSGGIDILINTVGVNCHCAADGYKDEVWPACWKQITSAACGLRAHLFRACGHVMAAAS